VTGQDTDAGVVCRRARPDDRAAIISLLTDSYGGWHGERNEEFWDWKFERNPHGRARIYIGDDGGRIAGCYVLNPVKLHVGGTTMVGAQSVDAAVDSDYRGRHVFTDLAQTALREVVAEGIQPLFAFPTRGAFGGQVRVGYKPQLMVPKAYRPLFIPTLHRRFGDFRLEHVKRFDERFDVFSEAKVENEVSVQRDAEYLRWRYCDHPTQSYRTLTCERGDGELCGYSVLTVRGTRKRAAPGYVVELQTVGQSEQAAMFLAHHSVAHLRMMGARVGVSWPRPSGVEQAALAAVGFSERYVKLRRVLTRPEYVDQLIAYEDPEQMSAEQRAAAGAAESRTWALVPGDADYI
jgi:Acetyltransferase (GNAT) domain